MTEQEELFAKYYNHGKILVKDMDDVTLREHRESLRQIATEAKATLLAADDELRERNAKKKSKDWIVSVDHSQATSDALNNVKQRQARMTKLEKQRKQLLDIGMDEDIVNEMISNMERKGTEKNIKNLKTITFQKKTDDTTAIQVETKKNVEPFNPSSLFGKS